MPTPTYDLIASSVLSSATASVSFASIPSTYRDLILVFRGSSTVSEALGVYYNDDTSGYGRVFMYGTGSSAASGTDVASGMGVLETSSTAAWGVLHIMDYSATDKHKTGLSRADTVGLVIAEVNRWASTAAINKITVDPFTGNLNAGTTLYLYGIVS